MYCSVAFSFHTGRKPYKKNHVYKTDIKTLKRGDILEVPLNGSVEFGVVYNVFEKDEYNFYDMERQDVSKKLHTNTVKAAIRKRFNEYKGVRVRTERKKGARLERKLIRILGPEYQKRILKYICLGNMYQQRTGITIVCYANNFIELIKDKHGNYIILNFNKTDDFLRKWITPYKLKDYYEELYQSEFINSAMLESENAYKDEVIR